MTCCCSTHDHEGSDSLCADTSEVSVKVEQLQSFGPLVSSSVLSDSESHSDWMMESERLR